jgi:hypothetical protein
MLGGASRHRVVWIHVYLLEDTAQTPAMAGG